MALEVIGAGFGRTGTESMKQALEMLGFGPCHHMSEVLAKPRQLDLWRAAAKGEKADWQEVLAGYRSAVDWPAAFFWRELSAYYPDAKVLLTVRSSDSWYASIEKTILPVVQNSTDPDSLGLRLIRDRVFDGRLDDRDHAIAVYERNTADVQAAFPPERLLTYSLGDGWEPLCGFLGCPIPDAPYPRTNSSAEFRARA
ncbi:MAG: sulfotransferase family protein [Pseudomonadota bacterium]